MRSRAVLFLVAASVVCFAVPATAVNDAATITTCAALWREYPTGVEHPANHNPRDSFAVSAMQDGFLRPRVVSLKVWARLWRKGLLTKDAWAPEALLCGKRPTAGVPETPLNLTATTPAMGADSIIDLSWRMQAPVYPAPSFDIFLNGTLAGQVAPASVAQGSLKTYSYSLNGLTSSTAYQVTVAARNDQGSSPPTSPVSFTTPNKSSFLWTFTARCPSRQCSVYVDNATGGEDHYVNVGDESWSFEYPILDNVIRTISVFDTSLDGSTYCSVAIDGRVMKEVQSNGGAMAVCTFRLLR